MLDRLAGYRLESVLGSGGQGTVYLGVSPNGDKVAVKVLHPHLVKDPEARRRFVREVAAARQVEEFSTARVLDVDADGEQPYVVSEYVAGESLQELVARDGPRGLGGLRRLAISTAAALAAIHRAGIVHRDFKPSNVLLGPDGPRVIDFGIARALESTATMTSGLIGTPAYMAPEQVAGEAVGPPTDVFAWGLMLVFAATGRPAFGDDSVPAVWNRVLNVEPDLSALPEGLRGLVAACLAKRPEQRPTAQQVVQSLLGGPVAANGAPATLLLPGSAAPQSAGVLPGHHEPASGHRATRPAGHHPALGLVSGLAAVLGAPLPIFAAFSPWKSPYDLNQIMPTAYFLHSLLIMMPVLATWGALRRRTAAAIALPILFGVLLVGGTITTVAVWLWNDFYWVETLFYVAVVAAIVVMGILLRGRSPAFTVMSILPAAGMLVGLLILIARGGAFVLYAANATLVVWALWFAIRHRALLRQTP
ncbi:serine/threonine-protein kinase [Nonomuraea sp. NPDC049152]|uniref:serine/threonine-protein kinase n=1 Tax=Nonomuraea sp. NPDC049152 TaxID=3154350 RepID=UPI0033E20218